MYFTQPQGQEAGSVPFFSPFCLVQASTPLFLPFPLLFPFSVPSNCFSPLSFVASQLMDWARVRGEHEYQIILSVFLEFLNKTKTGAGKSFTRCIPALYHLWLHDQPLPPFLVPEGGRWGLRMQLLSLGSRSGSQHRGPFQLLYWVAMMSLAYQCQSRRPRALPKGSWC